MRQDRQNGDFYGTLDFDTSLSDLTYFSDFGRNSVYRGKSTRKMQAAASVYSLTDHRGGASRPRGDEADQRRKGRKLRPLRASVPLLLAIPLRFAASRFLPRQVQPRYRYDGARMPLVALP